MSGFFLFLGYGSNTTLTNSSFSRGLALFGAAIFADTSSIFVMRSSTIEYSRGLLGSILLSQGLYFEVSDSLFQNNAGADATDLKVADISFPVNLRNNTHLNGEGGGSLAHFTGTSLTF